MLFEYKISVILPLQYSWFTPAAPNQQTFTE